MAMTNSITKPIPVRIPQDGVSKLEKAARKLGTNRSRIIAFAVFRFTEYAESQAVATLPPNWKVILKGSKPKTPAAAAGKSKSSKVRK